MDESMPSEDAQRDVIRRCLGLQSDVDWASCHLRDEARSAAQAAGHHGPAAMHDGFSRWRDISRYDLETREELLQFIQPRSRDLSAKASVSLLIPSMRLGFEDIAWF